MTNQVDWEPNDQCSTKHAALEGHRALVMAYGHQTLRQASLARLHPLPFRPVLCKDEWTNVYLSMVGMGWGNAICFSALPRLSFFLLSLPNYHLCAHKTYMLVPRWVRGKTGWICHGVLATSGKVTQTLF